MRTMNQIKLKPNAAAGPIEWTRACPIDRLRSKGQIAVKLEDRQVAVFLHDNEVLACDNRCPHEGYPLVEGSLDKDCALTCHWHNWRFDLKSGATLYGGDALRIYPAQVLDGAVWLDLRDPPIEERIGQVLVHLDEAMDKLETSRIARELARLGTMGANPGIAVARAIQRSHVRLRDGMTHAYAATDVWLRLRDTLTDPAQRLTCASEGLSYIALDTLRECEYPFPNESASWNAASFGDAVEERDERRATALLNGALADGMHLGNLEFDLAGVALSHYNDFGHSLIYLQHIGSLIQRLGTDVERPLLLAWLRSLVLATREDLLPDFRGYAQALESWSMLPEATGAAILADSFERRSVRETLAATVAARSGQPLELYFALLEAAARHLLRFDTRHESRTDNPVGGDVGWLDFTHALTFGHALRLHCEHHPSLWPQGLLQLAMFVGRNAKYLDESIGASQTLSQWKVADEHAFHERAARTILDHGMGQPIFPAHWLKTWTAVRDEIGLGVPHATRAFLLAAVNRMLDARLKESHALRAAHQALLFIGNNDPSTMSQPSDAAS